MLKVVSILVYDQIKIITSENEQRLTNFELDSEKQWFEWANDTISLSSSL